MAILGLGRPAANVAGAFAGTNSPSRLINSALTMGNRSALEQQDRGAFGVVSPPRQPGVSAADKAEAAWQEAMKLLQRQGPYSPEVTQQLINRQADQTATMEAVNAEEIRNQAAARGLDPTQALRQLQSQRQQSNIAFQGDIGSQAAIQNFAAETPGRMAAAQANLGRAFTGASTPAVTSGGIAFSGQRQPTEQVRYNPISGAQTGYTAFTPKVYGGSGSTSQPQQTATKKTPDYTNSAYMTPVGQRPMPGVITTTPTQRNALQQSLNQGIQYTQGVPAKLPQSMFNTNPFK